MIMSSAGMPRIRAPSAADSQPPSQPPSLVHFFLNGPFHRGFPLTFRAGVEGAEKIHTGNEKVPQNLWAVHINSWLPWYGMLDPQSASQARQQQAGRVERAWHVVAAASRRRPNRHHPSRGWLESRLDGVPCLTSKTGRAAQVSKLTILSAERYILTNEPRSLPDPEKSDARRRTVE